MREAFRGALAILFVVWPCLGAKGKPQTPAVIGQIAESSGATVDGVPALSSGTLIAGDTLATPKGGAALVRIPGNGQVELSENSTVGFSGTPGHVVAKIAQGTIVVRGPDPEFVVIEAAQCRIGPAQGPATFALTLPLGGSASITARAGAISVTPIGSGQARTLSPGETFVCPNLPAVPASQGPGIEESKPAPSEQAGQAAPPGAPKHSNTGLLILLLGGGAAAGIGAAAAAGGHGGGGGGPASPSAP
jgi:hypothetical protein